MTEFRFPPLNLTEPADIEARPFRPLRLPVPPDGAYSRAGSSCCANCDQGLPCASGGCSAGQTPRIDGDHAHPRPRPPLTSEPRGGEVTWEARDLEVKIEPMLGCCIPQLDGTGDRKNCTGDYAQGHVDATHGEENHIENLPNKSPAPQTGRILSSVSSASTELRLHPEGSHDSPTDSLGFTKFELVNPIGPSLKPGGDWDPQPKPGPAPAPTPHGPGKPAKPSMPHGPGKPAKPGKPRRAVSVDNPGDPCIAWTWHTARASLPRLPFREPYFEGLGSPWQRARVRRIFAQALGLIDVTRRVMHYALLQDKPKALWDSEDAHQPFFMDARPRAWLGPFSAKKWLILDYVCSMLWWRMSYGYNGTNPIILRLWPGVCGGSSACHLSIPRIRLNSNIWSSEDVTNWPDDPRVGLQAWAASFQIPSQRSKYWAMGNDVTSETLGPGHPSLISFFGPYNDARFHFIRSKYLKVIQKMYSGGVRISCHHPDLPDCDGSVVGLTEGDDIYICGDFTNPVKYSQEWTRTKLVMHELFHLSGLGHLTEDPDCCVNGDCACGTHEARQKLIAEGNFDILLAEQWTYDIFNRYFLRSMMELSVCYPGIRSSPGVFSI